MPVKPPPKFPPTHKLSQFEGQVIELTADPIREVNTPMGKSYVATLADGDGVWLKGYNVASFELPENGGHAGRYLVVSFEKMGKTGYALRNENEQRTLDDPLPLEAPEDV